MLVDLAILERTLRIKYGTDVGSGVYIQINGVCMILTAAHLVRGISAGDRIGIRFKSDWALIDVTGVAHCERGTDVCVIRTRTQWGEGLGEDRLQGGITIGEEVAYCGFPLNLEVYGMPGALGWPKGFVKGAIFSGGVEREEGGYDYLFDTINNRGFSGGPIVKRENGKLRVVAVVSGYKYDAPSAVYRRLPNGEVEEIPDYFVRPNSGFMIGVPIIRAVEAAKRLA